MTWLSWAVAPAAAHWLTLALPGKRILLPKRGGFLPREMVNPALTVLANAIRGGEHLISRMS